MSTTVLAYLILFMGFITFLAGAFGVLMLLFEDLAKTGRVLVDALSHPTVAVVNNTIGSKLGPKL
jgi:phage-related protein